MIFLTKSESDGPIKAIIEWDIDALVQEARAAAPIGAHTHDRGIAFKKWLPRAGGALKAEIGNKANWRYRANGNSPYARITLKHPGAYALEFGAHVAAVAGKIMRWMSPTGPVATRGRGEFNIPPHPFAEKILERFVNRTGVNAGIRVGWTKGPHKRTGGM
jgi:hypothetical protein